MGYIRRAHGIRGAVVVNPLTDDPDRFSVGRVLETDNRDHPNITIVAAQPHTDGLLVTLEGVTDRNTAETLRGTSLLIAQSQRRGLDADEFWPDDLIGLLVVDPAGVELGRVTEVVEGGAQDRLQVTNPEGRFEVPFVAAIVTQVDIAGGRMIVDPPEGLFGDSS